MSLEKATQKETQDKMELSPGTILGNPKGLHNHTNPCSYLLLSRDRESDGRDWWTVGICSKLRDVGVTGIRVEKRTPAEVGELEVIGVIDELLPWTYPEYDDSCVRCRASNES